MVAHAVDDLTILASTSWLKQCYVNGDIDFEHMSTSDILSKLVPAPTHLIYGHLLMDKHH